MLKRGHTTKCRDCADKASALTKATKAKATVLERFMLVHYDRYDYSLVEYINSYTKVKIICPTHGEFSQLPDNRLQGMGCPSCANNGFDKTKSAILYYLRVTDNAITAYKIGITNRTVQERFNNTDLKKIQVLKTWDFPLGSDVYNKEQEILKLYKEFKYLGEPLLSSGNTELFTKDILGLDN